MIVLQVLHHGVEHAAVIERKISLEYEESADQATQNRRQ
ncbi:hypothetical protein SDC9_81915 [bioreactor metagenome]|uniref:Uncharacterized protein n=1 Tax=bioreactor metagenome TaxID=1076179 RepID=A0A644Z330_9ZZZZ